MSETPQLIRKKSKYCFCKLIFRENVSLIRQCRSKIIDWSIDCMMFNVVFNSILVISWRPVHLSMRSWSSFNQYSAQYSFQANWLRFPLNHCKTTDSGERGMNPVAMAIIDPQKEYWPSRGSNQLPPVFKSATLPTELWGPVDLR